MSKVRSSNPFDKAFRQEMASGDRSSGQFVKSILIDNFSLEDVTLRVDCAPSSADSMKTGVLEVLAVGGDQMQLNVADEYRVEAQLQDGPVVALGPPLAKYNLQNALLNKIQSQTKRSGLKSAITYDHRYANHSVGLNAPLKPSECSSIFSSNDSDTKRRNRDAAKKSRERKKIYINKLEKEIERKKKNEKILKQKLSAAEEIIKDLRNQITQQRGQTKEVIDLSHDLTN